MPNRRYSEIFRRQVVEEILSGEHTMLGQSRRYEISRSLLHDWVGKYRADGLADGYCKSDRRREPLQLQLRVTPTSPGMPCG